MTKLTEKQESLLNELLEDFKGDTESVLGQHGLMNELRKRVVEAILDGEMTSHLGYAPHDPAGNGSGNSRNGHTAKKVQSKNGELALEIPRDRNSRFEPQVLRKGQRRMDGMDETIIALYARGLSTRGIQEELEGLYGAEVSPTLISNVTNSVLEEVQAWQARALDPVYPIIYFDCLFVKSRQDGSIRNKAVYLALGINLEGEKELLGMWRGETEGAQFWLSVFNELKNRGVQDCFINSLRYVTWKDRKRVAADLRAIYTAPTVEAARAALGAFAEHWGEQYPAIAPGWERNWERLTPFFGYPPEIRKVVYTTNAIESLNYSLRKIIKGRGALPHDDSIRKLLYLGLKNTSKKWTMPVRDWKAALNQFIILFGVRVPV